MVILGRGPSLTLNQVDQCRNTFTIAVNDTHRLAKWANILYACDLEWWRSVEGAKYFAGEKWTINKKAAHQFELNHVPYIHGNGLQLFKDFIHCGQNSGHQAVNIAIRYAATKIILLGFDHKHERYGKTHFFGAKKTNETKYQGWMEHWQTIAYQAKDYGIEIVNCSPESAIKCFPKIKLSDALK